jgi:serine protease Do
MMTSPYVTATESSRRLDAIFAGAPPRTADELKEMQAHIRRLAEQIIPCTVAVRVGVAYGSGVIISRDGYVLTAAHVAGKPGRAAAFMLSDGRFVAGTSLGMNVQMDAGLMKITDAGGWPFLSMDDSQKLDRGQWCLATGHAGGFERGRKPALRLGRVMAITPSGITTDCTLIGGDSGGPLVNMSGKIIGIHSRVGVRLASNVHVPIHVYSKDWDRLVAGEAWNYMTRSFIGVVGSPESNMAAILNVHPSSPADKAGMRAGDVVVRFDDRTIRQFDELREAVATKNPGDMVELEVRRGEKTVPLKVTIGRRDE